MSSENGNGFLRVGAQRLAEMALLAGVLWGTLGSDVRKLQADVEDLRAKFDAAGIPAMRERVKQNEKELERRSAIIESVFEMRAEMRALRDALDRETRARLQARD